MLAWNQSRNYCKSLLSLSHIFRYAFSSDVASHSLSATSLARDISLSPQRTLSSTVTPFSSHILWGAWRILLNQGFWKLDAFLFLFICLIVFFFFFFTFLIFRIYVLVNLVVFFSLNFGFFLGGVGDVWSNTRVCDWILFLKSCLIGKKKRYVCHLCSFTSIFVWNLYSSYGFVKLWVFLFGVVFCFSEYMSVWAALCVCVYHELLWLRSRLL